jgi:hypothetical protein|tara:strand:- start:36 stop:476 length:441 start_codon:yes stop_codon:yes gene_type:complete
MTYYIGTGPTEVIGSFIKRYFYGLRRNDDGELFLVRSDQLSGVEDPITVNEIGIAAESFLDFEEGIDFLSGIDENHNIVYDNLRYPQFKWDSRALSYKIDYTDGQFVQRLSSDDVYPSGISSPGYGDGDDNLVLKNNTYSAPGGDY